jgi:S-adenosylmethionine:tRNA ribosyltransferase-isomerase
MYEMEDPMIAAVSLQPAVHPRGNTANERLLVIDAEKNRLADARVGDLPKLVDPGDLVVVNDAATFPASLRGRTRSGELVEARLVEAPRDRHARAILFGAGDWHTKTEDRKAPPVLKVSDEIFFDGLTATVVRVDGSSARLVELFFDREGVHLWKALFSAGKPVQYAYIDRELDLWDVQTPFASRPFAAEMPSAGRPLSWSTLSALQRRGVKVARLSHAAGISCSGDAALDARLPLAERFSIPTETVAAITSTKKSGARVIAIGTTVVRALEGSFASNDALVAGDGETDWLGSANTSLNVVDAIFSGMHERETSHFSLLEAFAPRALLERALTHAASRGYLAHEFGDACFIGRRVL